MSLFAAGILPALLENKGLSHDSPFVKYMIQLFNCVNFWREYVGIEPTRDDQHPTQVLKTRRHTSYLSIPGFVKQVFRIP